MDFQVLKIQFRVEITFMIVGGVMRSEWESMTIDELFSLREQMAAILSAKLVAKKVVLERRLEQLNQQPSDVETVRSRRP